MLAALAVALWAAPAAAAVEFEPCPQVQADEHLGPWRCDAFIVGPQDLRDYWGNTAALSGNTMVLGYAGEPWLDKGEFIVLTERPSGWEESARLPVRGQGKVSLHGDTIAIADMSAEGSAPATAVRVFVKSPSAWVQQAMLTDDAWDTVVPSVALAKTRLVTTTLSGAKGETCDEAPQAASIYAHQGDSWILEATVTPDYDPCLDPAQATLAATDEHVVLGISKSAHVFRREGAAWTAEVIITPSQAGEGKVSALALAGDRLVLLTSSSNAVDVVAHIYRFDGAGWTAETKLAVPQSPEIGPPLPRVHLDDGRVIVTTGQLNDALEVGSIYVFRDGAEWYEEARLRTAIESSNSWFSALAADRGMILALQEPYSEPYFGRFELYVRSDTSPDPATPDPIPNPCDAESCDEDVNPVEDESREQGCGCMLPANGGELPDGPLLALVVAACRRRTRRASP